MFRPWRNLQNNALSSLHKLLRNRLVGEVGGGGCINPPATPTHITGRVQNSECKDDSALFSWFLHGSVIRCHLIPASCRTFFFSVIHIFFKLAESSCGSRYDSLVSCRSETEKSLHFFLERCNTHIQSCEWNDKSANRERESRTRIGSNATFFWESRYRR